MDDLSMYAFSVLCITGLLVFKIVDALWWRPKSVELHYSKQGIKGPPYRFFVGNVKELVSSLMLKASYQPMRHSHDILPRVLFFYHHCNKIYGANFLLWIGPTPHLTVTDPNLIQEVLVSKAEYYEKIESHPFVKQLGGDGLLNLNGEKWAYHRKIIQPTFHKENLKLLIPVMGKQVLEMLDKWSIQSSSDGYEIEVSDSFQTLTEEIITRTIFRSSYTDAKTIFQLQAKQMVLAAESFQTVYVPGYRFVPTEKNRSSWRLNKEISKSLVRFIERGKETYSGETHNNDASPKDLLGLMFRAGVQEISSLPKITDHDIVEECKSFFFAGKETTSNLLTWTTILLAMHPEWQDLAREEVLMVCGSHEISTIDDIAKLKTLSMIISESLRLYPPVVAVVRRAKTNIQLGNYKILCGSELLIPTVCVHHNPELWGNDAAEFNPARFTKGVSHAAKHPMGYIPFGTGGHICIGRNLAILQAKLTIATILRRYSFRLSPNYQHAPTVLMLLRPLYGAPITFRCLEDVKRNLDQGS